MESFGGSHPLWHHVLVGFAGAIKYSILAAIWFGIGLFGYLFFQSLPSPFSIVLGVGFIGVGGTLCLASLYELAIRLLSIRYTRMHCFICLSQEQRKYPQPT